LAAFTADLAGDFGDLAGDTTGFLAGDFLIGICFHVG